MGENQESKQKGSKSLKNSLYAIPEHTRYKQYDFLMKEECTFAIHQWRLNCIVEIIGEASNVECLDYTFELLRVHACCNV